MPAPTSFGTQWLLRSVAVRTALEAPAINDGGYSSATVSGVGSVVRELIWPYGPSVGLAEALGLGDLLAPVPEARGVPDPRSTAYDSAVAAASTSTRATAMASLTFAGCLRLFPALGGRLGSSGTVSRSRRRGLVCAPLCPRV